VLLLLFNVGWSAHTALFVISFIIVENLLKDIFRKKIFFILYIIYKMKMDDYKLPELRTIAKYLEIEGWNKMKRADLEAQIFLKEVSDAMENNMKREHYQQVKYPVTDTSNCINLEDLVGDFYIRNNIPVIQTHQL
jgi:hypothetical protein